jgi:predicted nucleotidyltransferase
MRLTPQQIHSIKQVAFDVFGSAAQVYLFGSRVDDQQRGGDIDLYVAEADLSLDAQLDAKLKFLVKIKQQLGDQRIDVVFAPAQGQVLLPIHRMAQQSGVPL